MTHVLSLAAGLGSVGVVLVTRRRFLIFLVLLGGFPRAKVSQKLLC